MRRNDGTPSRSETCVDFQAHSQMRSPAALVSALRYPLPTANNDTASITLRYA
jgi:hypothetical protein